MEKSGLKAWVLDLNGPGSDPGATIYSSPAWGITSPVSFAYYSSVQWRYLLDLPYGAVERTKWQHRAQHVINVQKLLELPSSSLWIILK